MGEKTKGKESLERVEKERIKFKELMFFVEWNGDGDFTDAGDDVFCPSCHQKRVVKH